MQKDYKINDLKISIGVPTNGTASLLTSNNTHKYLKFEERQNKSLIKAFCTEIINTYLETEKSSKCLERENVVRAYTWGEGNNKSSKLISYKVLYRHMIDTDTYNTEHFNINPYECFWLDSGIELSINWHMNDGSASKGLFVKDGYPKQQFSDKFPLSPQINKEGILLSNFNPFLIKKIISNRNELVESSEAALTFEWFYKLKSLINDTISLLDITLNQIYLKAMYDPLANWTFDILKLGERHNRKLNDKLKWVYQITGKQINIEKYRSSLDNLRKIRNHLNHFDPPTIAFHIEEVKDWMNQIVDVANIVYLVRRTINVQTSSNLMTLLLQKKVIFIPEDSFKERLSVNNKFGYNSSTWQ